MAKQITVTPEQLRNAAKTIESLAGDYQQAYEELYKETDMLKDSWQGKDNVAFITQISGFKDDFEKMVGRMNEYVTFLRQSAKSYEETQTAIASEAAKLVN